jgi:hypothetical protein
LVGRRPSKKKKASIAMDACRFFRLATTAASQNYFIVAADLSRAVLSPLKLVR